MKKNILLLVAFAVSFCDAFAQTMLHNVAQPRVFPEGAPKYSDVIVRSASAFKGVTYGPSAPDGISDKNNVLSIGAKYHITRVDWSYIANIADHAKRDDIIAAIKAKGWNFGSSLNASTFNPLASLEDRFGVPIVIPWFNPGVYAGCVNKPLFQSEYSTELNDVLVVEPGSIQQDDTEMGYGMARIGETNADGCYCSYCTSKAATRGYDIINNHDHMLQFQKESVVEFYDNMLGGLEGGPLAGNGEGTSDIYGDPFAYNCAERTLWGCFRPIIHWDIAKSMATAGRSMVYTGQDDLTIVDNNPQNSTNGFRLEIGICYAVGINFMVPWDQWLRGENNSRRYWGDPALFTDMYGFVRANAHFLDGYEDAVISGFGGWTTVSSHINPATFQMIEDRYPANEDPLQVDSDNPNTRVAAFGRAVPGDSDAPKVVHLVEWWGGTPQRHIRLRVPNYFPVSTTVDKAITVRLHRPRGYDASVHDFAENTKNYSALCEVVPMNVVPEGNGTLSCVMNVPGVTPWGFLVIEKGGIQGQWSFDGNSDDYSPNHLNATISNAYYSDLSCYSKNSLFLTGTGSYASIPDNTKLDIGTGDFSFATWFYRETSPTTNLRILSKGAGYEGDAGYSVWGSDTSFTVGVAVSGGSRLLVGAAHNGVGKWTHIAVNVKRNDKMELYVDGVLKSSVSCAGLGTTNINSSRPLNIGCGITAGAQCWTGRVDDVRVYNRVLAPSEIKLLASKSVQ